MTLNKKYYWAAVLLPIFLITVAALKPELGVYPTLEKVMCNFRLESPYDRNLATNVTIGTEWTQIKLPKPLESTSHIQQIEIVGNPATHELVFDPIGSEQAEFPGSESFQPLSIKQLAKFSVKIYNQNKQEVRLNQNTAGAIVSTNPTTPFLGFSLYDSVSNKFYFEPDFKGTALFIKATVPTQVKSINWTAPDYTKNPCHSWDDIQSDEIYHFGKSNEL